MKSKGSRESKKDSAKKDGKKVKTSTSKGKEVMSKLSQTRPEEEGCFLCAELHYLEAAGTFGYKKFIKNME